jgi:hypothetical protein
MAIEKEELIRRRAHEIWENEGRPDGADLRHWQRAADELSRKENHQPARHPGQRNDRDDVALLQGAGESGDVDPPPAELPEATGQGPQETTRPIPDVEITTGEKPARRKVRKTEGP